MLNIKEAITLLLAGFTADEIRAMQQPTQDPAPVNVPAPAQDPAPVNVPAPAQDPAPVNVPAPAQDPAPVNVPTPAQPGVDMTVILQSIAELTAAVQANGIANSQQPKQPDRADVLASIIVPNK